MMSLLRGYALYKQNNGNSGPLVTAMEDMFSIDISGDVTRMVQKYEASIGQMKNDIINSFLPEFILSR